VWAPLPQPVQASGCLPGDGIRVKAKPLAPRPADGFAILVRLLSEAKCLSVASRRPALSKQLRNCKRDPIAAYELEASKPNLTKHWSGSIGPNQGQRLSLSRPFA
jgi:hypothetical protein